jgi:hypothetical protein
MWGQGLKRDQKFHQLVKNQLQANLERRGYSVQDVILRAHSGAIIGLDVSEEDKQNQDVENLPGEYGGEINLAYPTILNQVKRYIATWQDQGLPDPKSVELVLVDGCINDVGAMLIAIGQLARALSFVKGILYGLIKGGIMKSHLENTLGAQPAPTQFEIKTKANRTCYDGMKQVLKEIVDPNRGFTNAKIVVTGAHIPISDRTDLSRMIEGKPWLRTILVAPIYPILHFIKEKAASNFKLFHDVSSQNLQRAVAETNADLVKLPPCGSTCKFSGPRVSFAKPNYKPESAMYTSHPWYWEPKAIAETITVKKKVCIPIGVGFYCFQIKVPWVHINLVANDPVFGERKWYCKYYESVVKIRSLFDHSTCPIASTGHPNVAGDLQYAGGIMSVLPPEWQSRMFRK